MRAAIHKTLLPLSFIWSSAALALPAVPEQNGWAGYVGVGVAYIDIESNTVAGNSIVDLDNDRLDNINDSPSGRDTVAPAVLGEVTWTYGDRQQLFFGTSVEDAVTLDGGAQIGWRRGTDTAGTFQISGLFNRLVPTEVYEDPFLTGSKRKKTDRDTSGVRFQWDRIFGSKFEWQLTSRKIDIDTERSGLAAGLNPDQRKILRRSGDELSTRVSYLFALGEGHSLRPLIGYKDFDADGDSQSFASVRAQLTYAYRGAGKLQFVSNISVAERDYDKQNPLYGDDQDADVLVLDATVLYELPWGDGQWQAFGNALWGESDADIDFYDQNVLQLTVGAQYRFGKR